MGAVYLGVGGVRREMKSTSVGINGVRREVSEIYAGISGVRRLVWQKKHPGSALAGYIEDAYLSPDEPVKRLIGAIAYPQSDPGYYSITWDDVEDAKLSDVGEYGWFLYAEYLGRVEAGGGYVSLYGY